MTERTKLTVTVLLAASWLAVAVLFMAIHLSPSGALLATLLLLFKQAGALLFHHA